MTDEATADLGGDPDAACAGMNFRILVLLRATRSANRDVLDGAPRHMSTVCLDELLARSVPWSARGHVADLHRPVGAKPSSAPVLNTQTREVLRGTRPINLTRTEFALLEAFMRHPRRVLERSWLLNEVWGFDFPTTANSLEVYIGYLRRKTESAQESRLIHTVRGVGYACARHHVITRCAGGVWWRG